MIDNYFTVGIDLRDDFTQVGYYGYKDKEPASVDFSGLTERYMLPTLVSKSIGKDEWFAGDEAQKSAKLGEAVIVDGILGLLAAGEPVRVDDYSVMPVEIMQVFLEYLISSAMIAGESNHVDRLTIVVDEYDITLLEALKAAVLMAGISESKVSFLCRQEAFIYYVLASNPELRRSDVVLFDYDNRPDKQTLDTYRFYSVNHRNGRIVMVHSEDYSKFLADEEESLGIDGALRVIAEKAFDKRPVSCTFLTGCAFTDSKDYPGFIKYVCAGRKVFAGQNIYCSGACYEGLTQLDGDFLNDYIIACSQRITSEIDMRVKDRGSMKILRLVKPGINWYSAGGSYDFIVDGADRVELFVSPVTGGESTLYDIPLGELPTRPDKATRIRMNVYFTGDSRCHITIEDCGFGEFFKATHKIISKEITL